MINLRGVALLNAAEAAGFQSREDFVDGGISITIQHQGETVFAVRESGHEDRARAERAASEFLRKSIKDIALHGISSTAH
jgi:hypothetical protein